MLLFGLWRYEPKICSLAGNNRTLCEEAKLLWLRGNLKLILGGCVGVIRNDIFI